MKRLISLIAVLSIAGCSTLSDATNTSKLIVEVATMKVIEAQPDRHARAQNILDITKEAKTWLDMDGVTVELLKSKVLERIGTLNLQPSDQLLAGVLVDAVVADLQAKVGEGLIPAEKLVTVNQVLSWVSEAASFY